MEPIRSYSELLIENKQLRELLEQNVMLEGWKGRDSIEITRSNKFWMVLEHRKDKDSKSVTQIVHKISNENLVLLWSIIKALAPAVGTKTSYRKIVPILIEKFNLQISIESFNGGRNRAKSYFPLYYYPCKILELHFKAINYSGRGIITRLK